MPHRLRRAGPGCTMISRTLQVSIAISCMAVLAACSSTPPPQPERRVTVVCPPFQPTVQCPGLPRLDGTVRIDEDGTRWIDADPEALAHAWLDMAPRMIECQEALHVWEASWDQCRVIAEGQN